jgi:hypothetical protein
LLQEVVVALMMDQTVVQVVELAAVLELRTQRTKENQELAEVKLLLGVQQHIAQE